MRSIWKGAISFGLVNVPVKLYSAQEDHNVRLHQVHDADGGRIRYQRRCEICGQVIDFAHINKAYDDGEQTVVLTDDDLAALPAERSREIEVVEFVPNEQIDPILFDRTYYLEPDSKSPKAYLLLRRTLEETEQTAIVKFAMRQRTRLAALRVRGEALALQTLLWADEVRSTDFLDISHNASVSDKELQMAAALVESFSGDFDPEQYEDEYQVELQKLITAKLEAGQTLDTEATFGQAPEPETGGEVIDLMEALRRSVATSKAAKKSASGPKSQSAKKAADSGEPAKKTAKAKEPKKAAKSPRTPAKKTG